MKFILLITKGIIRDQNTRRSAMFIILLIALLMLFAGATFLNSGLMANPWMFVVYWGVCAWLTIVSVLLAIFDMLAIRARAREERRALRAEIFGERNRKD